MDKENYIVCSPNPEGGLGFEGFIQYTTIEQARSYLRSKQRDHHTSSREREHIRLYRLVEVQ
jgi:hypothetical protein